MLANTKSVAVSYLDQPKEVTFPCFSMGTAEFALPAAYFGIFTMFCSAILNLHSSPLHGYNLLQFKFGGKLLEIVISDAAKVRNCGWVGPLSRLAQV